uniref:YDG domain-containing protein n=1 Tax=Enterocloster sp. TaxID=2719315 RepID=UPI003FEE7841
AFDGKLVKDAADENYAVATAYFPAGEYEFDIETGIAGLGDSNGSFQLKQQTVRADISGTDIRALNDMQTLSGELDLSQGDITFTEEAGNLVVSYYQKGEGSKTAVLKTVRGQSYDTWYTIVTSQTNTGHSLVLTNTSSNKDVNLVLKNVNIKAVGNTAPIQINGNSRAAVYLEGSNSVLIQKEDDGDSPAGISVGKDAQITIDSKTGQEGSIEIVNRSTGDSDAAIGGSKNQDTGTVIINGGSVTAKLENINRNYGSSAAAIGSSAGKSVKLIQINGGTVTAATNGRGAGIGTAVASSNDRNGTIVINGGTIEATSYQGAGIGSGVGVSKQVAVEERTKTNIEIHGGSIIAGSSSGASIGSGDDGAANVMIDGGTIGLKGTKSLPSQCADIGKGQSNSSYAITSVMVKGGSIYITDVRRNPVLAGWKQNENQGWERELPTDGKDSAVYYTTADLFTVYGAKVKVENASLQDISYGFEDVYTNSQGKIGIYLPAAASVKATFNGIHYNGKVEAGSNSNVLERDLTTINYKEELLNNSSQTALEFAQSKDASQWASIPVGGSASLTGILDAQADNATEFSLYVRKQGSGEATEIKIPARPGKPKQVDDVMRSHDYIAVLNYNAAYEYGITDRESEGSTVRWQDSSCFDGLQAAHTYDLVVRIKATESQFASKPSDIKTVTTQDVLRIAGSGDKEFITSGTYGQPLSQVTVQMADGYCVVNAHDQTVSGTWNWSVNQDRVSSENIYPEVNGRKSYYLQFTPDDNPDGLYGYSLGKSVYPDISPKKLTATISSSMEKTYDGSSEIAIHATVDTGITGQTLTISGLKGRFEDANVGTGKKVIIDPSEVTVTAGERLTKPENYQITFAAETTGTILPAQGTVTIDPKEWPGQKTYGDARFLLTGITATGDGSLTYTSSDESVLSVDDQGMVSIKGAGLAKIGISMENGTNYIGTSALEAGTIVVEKGTITFTLTAVNKNSQTQMPQTVLGTHEDSYDIIASAEGVYDDKLSGWVTFYNNGEPFAKAQLTDGKAVTNWVNPGESSPTAVGQHTMRAEYELTNTEDTNYQKPDPAAFSFEIGKADENEVQIVAVDGKVYGDAPFDLEVSGQKGTGAVIYSVPEDNGVLELPDNHGSDVKIIGAGTVMVTAAIAGDEKYNGTTVTRKITIGKAAAPQIIWPTASSVEAGSSLSAAVLTGGSTEYGSFTWKDPALLAEAGTRSYEVVFTPNEWTAKNYEIRPMIGVVELTAAVPAPDNRDHNTADRDSSSDRDASSAAIRKDQIKGRISSDRGIITGAANSTANDGYSHWMQDAYGWWLRFADNSYPKGKKHGTSGIAYAWELINGNWWAFDENGYAKTGWLRDETFGGWFYIDPKRGMQIGWVLIDGVWYYFHPVSDGRKGIMYAGQKTPDGYYVDENGAWDGKEK